MDGPLLSEHVVPEDVAVVLGLKPGAPDFLLLSLLEALGFLVVSPIFSVLLDCGTDVERLEARDFC